jgi:methyltransferase (TIGR00027 family)
MRSIYDKTIEKPCGFLFARWSAGAKAFEMSLPDHKRIITDRFAPFYAGKVGMDMVKAMHVINPSVRKGIVLRARYFDDYAVQCIDDGYSQVVLLGAGYDSRYLRLSEFCNINVFELDLLSTQTIKKALTRRLLGGLPPNVRYVTIDFSKDNIIETLIKAGFQSHRRTLFIWEGVTLFLNQDIIAKTLGRLAELGPHHRVVFDFIPQELVDDETDYLGNRRLLNLCASIKEPLTFGSRPEIMEGLLSHLGFGQIKIVGLPEAYKRYTGSDQIEDSYYFATAEVNSDGSNSNGSRIIIPNGKGS